MQLTFFVIFFSLTFSSLAAFEFKFLEKLFAYKQERNEAKILAWAHQNLPQEGTLKRNRDGYVFLKVDDGYINDLCPMLQDSAYEKPPFFRRPNSPGAHISVFYVRESKEIGRIAEIGYRFFFKLKGLTAVPSKTREYIVLQVKSPGLEKLRQKYGQTPLRKGRDFHITIAKKKR